jgi:coatomer subunit beta
VSAQLLTIVFNALSVHLTHAEDIERALLRAKEVIGELPLLQRRDNEEEESRPVEKRGLRQLLVSDSIFGGVFARAVSKLLYKLRRGGSFNRLAAPILLVLCSLLRHYQSHLSAVDQAVVDQLTVILRRVVDSARFVQAEDALFEADDCLPLDFTFNEKKSEMIEKNPEDLIHFRLLRRTEEVGEFDYDDEEVNDILEQTADRVDYVNKLKSIVQLTGSFDPLYAEAFVRVNKYDLFFEILLINNSKSNLLNIQIEFSSSVEVLVLEKAQSVNLRPAESVLLRTQLRFSESEFGVIYGFINYDNQAGLEQPYLITEEITIDYMQFVEPAELSETNFKLEWQKAEHEVVFEHEIPAKAGR